MNQSGFPWNVTKGTVNGCSTVAIFGGLWNAKGEFAKIRSTKPSFVYRDGKHPKL